MTRSTSTPDFAARARPSAMPIAITEPMRLLTSLATSPSPTPPTCTTCSPSDSSSGAQARERGGRRADHDRQRPGLGRDRAAADRRVEHVHAERGEPLRQRPRRRRVDRARDEHGLARPQPGLQAVVAVERAEDVRRVGQREQHDVGALRELARAAGGADPAPEPAAPPGRRRGRRPTPRGRGRRGGARGRRRSSRPRAPHRPQETWIRSCFACKHGGVQNRKRSSDMPNRGGGPLVPAARMTSAPASSTV